jgi:hypothetical protein
VSLAAVVRQAPSTLLSATGTALRREITYLTVGSTALAAAMTWPALRHPTRTVPQDLVDPLYFVWQIAWTGHALGSDPTRLYRSNAFQQAHGNLAYTDAVLGYAPFAAVINTLVPGTAGALLVANLLFVAVAALAFGGAYALARVLGSGVPGALVLAAAYAYAPWHLAHARHLNVLSTGGIALALALLCRGHGWSLRDRAPGVRRPRLIVAGWLVACWQLTLGFAIGVPFAWVLVLVLGGAYLSWWARGRPSVPRCVRRADVAGAVCFGVTGVLLAIPYLAVVLDFPAARRTPGMVSLYSPPARGLVTPPPESLVWGSLFAPLRDGLRAVPEQVLLPGFALTALALAGLGYSAWSVRHRVVLALAALVSALLALGTGGPAGGRWTYLLVFDHVPGFEAVRTPGRLILWTTLALGLLAAGAVTRLSETRGRRNRRLLLAPALLVLAEGLGRVAHPVVPAPPVALSTVADPVLFLPTSQQGDYLTMAWSTEGWPRLVNGGSGFETPRQSHLRDVAAAWPQPWAVAKLRSRGVRTVVLTRSLAPGTRWAALDAETDAVIVAQAAAVGLTVEVGPEAIVYHLPPRQILPSRSGTMNG